MAEAHPEALPSDHRGNPPGEFVPVRAEERILILDVLRGLAMFGVLWSNLNDWYGTTDAISGFQRALEFATELADRVPVLLPPRLSLRHGFCDPAHQG
jgi:uncharacterized membrane protein YeiB